jgi:hypothetical protein
VAPDRSGDQKLAGFDHQAPEDAIAALKRMTVQGC